MLAGHLRCARTIVMSAVLVTASALPLQRAPGIFESLPAPAWSAGPARRSPALGFAACPAHADRHRARRSHGPHASSHPPPSAVPAVLVRPGLGTPAGTIHVGGGPTCMWKSQIPPPPRGPTVSITGTCGIVGSPARSPCELFVRSARNNRVGGRTGYGIFRRRPRWRAEPALRDKRGSLGAER